MKANHLALRCPVDRHSGSKVLKRHFGRLVAIQDAFHDIGSQESTLKNTTHISLVKTGCVGN
jgi:hypothetical protein